MQMLIDTHCHLDAAEFDTDRDVIAQRALDAGVGGIVIPAVDRHNFQTVIGLAERHAHCACALGIHPIAITYAQEGDLALLRSVLLQTPQTVAVGEIGLDYFVEHIDRDRQAFFFTEQLKLAKEFDLPVILHIRKAADDILKYLRRFKVKGGIAHAFNGSRQQADEFIKLGFKLGFGGAMTYPRALRIRELAATLPLDAIVLETDAPDIAPEWLGHHERNSPHELPKIAQVMADLRGCEVAEIIAAIEKNSLLALPKLAQLYTRSQVLL